MAKKTAKKKTTKKTAKKPAAKAPARKSAGAKKSSTAKKPTTKKVTKKKPAAKKKVVKKPAAKKPAAKKAPAKKNVAKKPAAKKTTKKTVTKKPAAKKNVVKKPAAKKTTTKKPAAKKTPATKKPAAKKAATTKADAAKPDAKGSGRKGITIVKPTKRSGSRSRSTPKFVMPERPMLLGPGSKLAKKPLIPSGPSAPKITSVLDAPKSRRKKSPLTKAKLDKFRALLIAKRAELLGDVVSMENEALRSSSGGASSTPSHLAEQGSENYDQTLSLNLAAQDRRLIKDIDEALARIEEGTFGLCELTGHPIPEARLTELPWARYTIEAALELEKRGTPG